jgi:cytochrome bd ubiquinol oxidase subunit II
MVTFWFIIDAFFWTVFFVLEGFDFGVGMLHAVVGRSETEQRTAVNTIGPFWDGNEVWLVVAGALIFAAFPQWYATMFSSLYLALVLVLIALMGRGVSFEYRSKVKDERWTAGWRWSLVIGSTLVPLLIGVALGDLLVGLPINKAHQYTGTFFDLLRPYGLWTGLTLVALSLLSGSCFLALKTTGDVRTRAVKIAPKVGWASSALVLGFVIWTETVGSRQVVPSFLDGIAVLSVVGAAWAAGLEVEGWAFASALVAMGSTVTLIFVNLHPDVMVSSISPAFSLTAAGTASPPYTLKVMTVVAVVVTPLVVAYQGWSYWVFRRRLVGPRERQRDDSDTVASTSTVAPTTASGAEADAGAGVSP